MRKKEQDKKAFYAYIFFFIFAKIERNKPK